MTNPEPSWLTELSARSRDDLDSLPRISQPSWYRWHGSSASSADRDPRPDEIADRSVAARSEG